MRIFACALALLLWCAAGPARADSPPIVTDNPHDYAQVFADSMTVSGIRPIRETFSVLAGGGAIPADAEAALLVYERANAATPASIGRIVEDINLSDTYRIIYLYHYFGATVWIFTRLEFVRIGGRSWALVNVSFADSWTNVAIATTPGFVESTPRR